MTNVWCVRAEFGTYTQHFVKGGYVAIGWMPSTDLSQVTTKEALYPSTSPSIQPTPAIS